jgi:hypothetical protein
MDSNETYRGNRPPHLSRTSTETTLLSFSSGAGRETGMLETIPIVSTEGII